MFSAMFLANISSLTNGPFSAMNGSVRNNSTINQNVVITGPKWTFIPIYYVVIAVASFVTNGTVMIAFFAKRSLRTPFNIYLMNLVTANFVYTCLKTPPDTINALYSGWWLSAEFCSLNQYGTYILAGGIRVCHTLITLNRLWAVVWPHSYRERHGRKMACLICLAGWVYVHAIILPGFVGEILYYRFPRLVTTCRLNQDAQWAWFLAIQILVFSLALLIVVGAYPVIWYMRKKRLNVILSAIQSGTATEAIGSGKQNSVELEDQPVPLVKRQKGIAKVHQIHNTEIEPEDIQDGRQQPRLRQTGRSSHAFIILTVLTLGVLVNWLPILSYFYLSLWIPFNLAYLQVSITLSAMQAIIDPILFVCALPDMRQTFLQILRRVKG